MKTNSLLQTTIRLTLALALVVVATFSTASAAPASGMDGKTAFARLKSLSGDWSGPKMMGTRLTMNYRVIAGGSAVLATCFAGTPMEMISVYYLVGDKLVLTHYCMLGNQPRMKLNLKNSTADNLIFDFAGGDNIKSTAMHMHAETLHFVSKNKLETTCTSCERGKACSQHTAALTRKN